MLLFETAVWLGVNILRHCNSDLSVGLGTVSVNKLNFQSYVARRDPQTLTKLWSRF